MELWVRSQDKERLTKVTDLRIYYASEESVWVIEDCDDLGYYKTQKRAFEVLDEIQNILKPKTIVLKDLNKLNEEEINQLKNVLSIIPPVNSIQELPTYVYEMPEE